MISRIVLPNIQKHIGKSRAIVVMGARQVGKTTLIEQIVSAKKDTLYLDGDDPFIRGQLEHATFEKIKEIIGKNKIVFIDEAQRIDGLGLTAKMIVDKLPNVQLFITGSSSLDLNQEIKEPLTGRKWEYQLFPISYREWEDHVGYLQAQASLDQRIIYGWYPEVIMNPQDEIEILKELTSSQLYKDILAMSGIRKPDILEKLITSLAYQIGSEISFNELANHLGIDKNTVIQYVNLLEKAFIVFRISAFTKNHRNEIKKGKKIYFYDTGIRNTIIRDYSPLKDRPDRGALWENFLFAEKIKQIGNNQKLTQLFFWRTTLQQEIDCIEVEGSQIRALEFKLNPNKKLRIPKTFLKWYDADTMVVHRDNFKAFLQLN